MNAQKDFVILDRKVISALKHEFSHMDSNRLVPKDILNLEFEMRGCSGEKMSIQKIIDAHKRRLETVIKYCNMALE